MWAEGVEGVSDRGPEVWDGARHRRSQECLQFGEGLLDRVEVRAVGRELAKAGTRRLDCLPHPGHLVDA